MTSQLDSFETALLTELRTAVEQRTPTPAPRKPRRSWSRRWVLAPVGIAAATLTAVLVLPGTGPEAAYAVTVDGNGEVHVRVDRLDDADGLEQALAAHGIDADITYLPADTQCAEGRYQEAPAQPRGSDIGFAVGGGYRVDLGPGTIRDGETIVISAAETSPVPDLDGDGLTNSGGVTASVGIATGPVAPCVPRPVPAGEDP